MKKNIILILLLAFIINACEKDDFCTKETPLTPNLILRFYDNANPKSLKPITPLFVWADGKDSIYKNVELDSISLPLNTQANQTIYNISKGTTVNKLTVKYTTQDIFISRSCGYKTIFNTVDISSNNGWFISLTPNQLETINNEYNAHVKVYH